MEVAIVVSNDNVNVTPIETIDAIKAAGFKNVFIQWYNKDWQITQKLQLDYCREVGLNVIFAHLGYSHINEIWLQEGQYLVEEYKKDLDVMKECGIDLVCMHLCSKSIAPQYGQIGLDRYKEITEYGKKLGIKVTVENTKLDYYQQYIVKGVNDEYMGACIDLGHINAFFKNGFDYDSFINKTYCVHIHDNDGSSDQHLIPFDGNADFVGLLKGLAKCNYDGPITLESAYKKNYADYISIDEFYKRCYKQACKLADMYQQLKSSENNE